MITIQEDSIGRCNSILRILAVDHHAEVNVFEDVPLNIDWNRYIAAGKNYKLFVAKDSDVIVGWIGFFVYDHLRHIDYKIAKEDWYYVVPSYRGKGIGRKLFEYAEKILKLDNVRRVMVTCKVDHDHSGLIESLGYTNHEKNFTKVLA